MAFASEITDKIQLGKTFYSNLHNEYLLDLQRGSCTCSSEEIEELQNVLLGLEYSKEIGIFDNPTEAIFQRLLSVIGGSIDTTTIRAYYGAFNKVIDTQAEIKTLLNSKVGSFTLPTGTVNRFFNVALKTGVAFSSISDLSVPIGSDITAQYTYRKTIAVDGVNYSLYVLEIAVPYSTPHEHKALLNGI